MKFLNKEVFFIILIFLTVSCSTSPTGKNIKATVMLPHVKNTANECYFLDEFMPIPDSLVTGRTGSVNLRYYNYSSAKYKDWPARRVVLSFYSSDNLCWSLFEELYITDD